MKLEKFIKILTDNGYSFEEKKEALVVTHLGYVYLSSLTTLPENVTFSNKGDVDLSSLTTLPENVTFSNGGYVDLRSLTTLPENVTFSNGGYVDLSSLTTLPENRKRQKPCVVLRRWASLKHFLKLTNKVNR